MSRLTDRAWKADRDEILAMARALELASKRLDATLERREISAEGRKAWEDAAHEWREARDAMFGEAFDSSPDPHLAAIRANEPAAVETAIRFLEADPIGFHAGYAKERLLRALKVVPLSADQTRRLRTAMMGAVDDRYRHELKEWCRLAPSLDLDQVLADLRHRVQSGNSGVRERALWSLDRIDEYLTMRQALVHRTNQQSAL
jgi:hypothetical protein